MSTPTAKRAEVAARRAQAVALRSQGQTWQAIADALGYADRAAAHKDVTRALAANRAQLAETVEDHRVLALERLDAMYRATLTVLDRLHVVVSHGRIIRDDEGEPLRDDGPELAAVKTLIDIEQRRARLLGLDAPQKLDTTTAGTVRYEVVGVDTDKLR
jgi:hypothetical protein